MTAMDLNIVQLCVSYAAHRSLLNLTKSKREELISLLEECLVMAFSLNEPKIIGSIYYALGNLFDLVHKSAKAIDNFQNVLSLITGRGHHALEMKANNRLGSIYHSVGEYHKAIEYQEKSLSIAQEIGDRWGEGAAYLNLGNAYIELGKYHKATEYQEKSLSIAKEIGERQAEGATYGNLGTTYCALGEYHKAIEYHEKNMSIAKEIGDRQGEGYAYGNLGTAYQSLGEYHKAIEYHEKRLIITEKIGDKQGEGATYGNLGINYKSLGEYYKAIEYHEKRLIIAKKIGDRQGEGATYGNLGVTYKSLGEYHKAIQYQEKRLSIVKEISDRQGEGETYGNLGVAYYCLGQYHNAIEYTEKRLIIAKEIGDRQGEGATYGNLGIAYQSLGEYRKAIEYHEKRLIIATEIGDRQGEGNTYRNLGVVYQCLGEYHKAIRYQERCLSIAKEIGDRVGQAASHNNIGLAYQEESSVKDLSKSREHLEKSIQCYEKLFDDLKDNDQFKVSFVDTFIIAYKFLSQVYIKKRQSEEALLVCEHGRARALKDLLFLKYHTTEKTESKEVVELADVKTICSHRNVSILFYNLHFNKVTYHSWVISSRNPSTFFYDELDNREALATIMSRLSEDERKNAEAGSYFQYLVDNCFQQLNVREGKGMKCEDRSMNILEHEHLESATSTNSLQLIENALKVFQKADRCIPDETFKGDRNALNEEDDDVVNYLDVLFHRLVSPVLDQLIHDELIIIPDGHLFMVPFAALQDPETGKYLSETKCIRLAPSLTTLKILQESSNDKHGEVCTNNVFVHYFCSNCSYRGHTRLC
ncbi:tetratricopeptide repeat protein 28 [Exaiptasia diaphana]|uniref:CHAT domain-containing protein n=1 Tax=Exaiptasia diaphana TaxID=2652724 RepID=A0A913XY66_EXADI|nr:tetratricopeptide repeat protein 28 [Exaiptasia diaphana]